MTCLLFGFLGIFLAREVIRNWGFRVRLRLADSSVCHFFFFWARIVFRKGCSVRFVGLWNCLDFWLVFVEGLGDFLVVVF